MSELTNIEDKGLVDRDYNRKSYMSESYDEMMSRVPGKAMQDQRPEKESEFKKPYLSESYEEMEQFFMPPFPGFVYPSFMFPDFPGPVPVFGDDEWMDGHTTAGQLPCDITCLSNRTYPTGKRCEKPIRCMWTRVTPSGQYDPNRWKILKNKDGETPAIGRIAIEKDATLYPVKIYPPGGDWGDNIPSGKDYFLLKVQYKDPNGTVCTDTVKVWCDACPADPALVFDDANTPDTIVKNDHISVCITGGKAKFTYVVSGTGYTWNSTGTNTVTSSNRNEQLDCADGACGDANDYSAVAEITITDDCGTVVTAEIRNEGGSWANCEYRSCCQYCGKCYCGETVVGKYKYKLYASDDTHSCPWPVTLSWNHANCDNDSKTLVVGSQGPCNIDCGGGDNQEDYCGWWSTHKWVC